MLPTLERSGWRDGTIALAQGCEPHPGGVSTISVENRCDKLAVVGGNSGGLKIFDIRDLSKGPLSVIPSAPPRVVTGCTALDRPMRSNLELRQGGHAGRVEAAAWLPDDDLLFVTGGDESIKIWDSSAAEECVTAVELRTQVRGVAVTHAPKAVAAAALGDATVRLVDLRLGRAMNTMQGHSASVMCVAWDTSCSNRLFSGGSDGTVRAWDVRMGARSLFLCDPYALEENRRPLKSALERSEDVHSFGPQVLRLRDIEFVPYRRSMNPNTFLGTDKARPGHTGRVFATGTPTLANFSPAPPPSSQMPERDKLRENLWNADATTRANHMSAPPMREYEHEASVAHRGAVISLAFMAGGRKGSRLVSCGMDRKLWIWNSSTGAPAVQNPGSMMVDSWSKAVPLQLAVAGSPEDVCFLPEGDRISIRCLKTGELLCGLSAHTQEVHCAAVVQSRGELLSGGNDGRLLRWKLEGSSKMSAEDIICLD